MDLMDTLYKLCLSVEEDYHQQLKKSYMLKDTNGLADDLKELFGNFESKKIKQTKDNYILNKNMTSSIATQLIKSWNNGRVMDIQKVKEIMVNIIQGNKTTVAEMKGIIDETTTMDAIKMALLNYTRTYNLGDRTEDTITATNETVSIEYLGGNPSEGADFLVTLQPVLIETILGPNTQFLTDIMAYTQSKSVIPFENKIKLDSFHITSGKKTSHINSYIDKYDVLQILDIKEQIIDLIDRDVEDNIEPVYEVTVNRKRFEYWVFMAIIFDKLSKKVPIFITTNNGKIQYKLCSDIVHDFIDFSSWNKHSNGSKFDMADPFTPFTIGGISEDKMKQEADLIAKQVAKDMVKHINSYTLWYTE